MWTLAFLWWSVGGPPWKVQRHCTLWLKVSPWRNLSFWQMCQDVVVVDVVFVVVFVCLFVFLFCLFLHSRWSHLEENSRRWVADGIKSCMCKNCPVSVFFVWHLTSRIPVSSNRFPCKYSLYRGAKYTRSYSLQPETKSWRSFLMSFSGRYAQRNMPDKYRSMVYVLKTKVRAHTLRSTWLRKDSFIKIHARNISCTYTVKNNYSIWSKKRSLCKKSKIFLEMEWNLLKVE